MPELFQTQREKALAAYSAAKLDFIAATIPYHSMQPVRFEVVDDTGSNAMAIARKNQVLSFFSYGKGDALDLGGSVGTIKAGESETNLVKAHSTNGASDYIIEGVGFSSRGIRVVNDQTNSLDGGTVADPVAVDASDGKVYIMDPGAIWIPPQCQSPFNLEQAMFQALMPLLSLSFTFDDKRTFKLGLVDLLPQAGAASFLRANGVPDSANRYEIPEGFLWRRDGQSDSELSVEVKLERDLVVPVNLVTFRGTELIPTDIFVDCVMRLFGLSLDLPSEN